MFGLSTYRKLLYVVPLLLLTLGDSPILNAQTQKLDSLMSLFESTEVDSLKFRYWLHYVQEKEKINRAEAIPESRRLVALANNMNDPRRSAIAAQNLGRNFLAAEMHDSAIFYLQESNKLFYQANDSMQVNGNNSNIALLYQRTNEYEKAAEMYLNVIYASENVKDYYSAAVACINHASLLMAQNINNRAATYLKKVGTYEKLIPFTKIEELERFRSLLPNVYLNLGQTYHRQVEEDPTHVSMADSAMYYYQLTISSAEKLTNTYYRNYIASYAYDSIGEMYKMQSRQNKQNNSVENNNTLKAAIINFRKALDGFAEIGDRRGMAFTSNNLGETHSELGQFNEALNYFNQAQAYADEIDFLEERVKLLKNLAKTHSRLGNYTAAYDILERYTELHDTLLVESRNAVISELDMRYQTEVKDREIAQLALSNEQKERRQQQQRNIFAGIIMTTLFGGVLLWYRIRLRQQKEKSEYEQQLNTAMSRFVPQEFLSAIGRNNILSAELGDAKETDTAIVFTDIRGYTSRSENMTPLETFEFVKNYMGRVGPIIRQHNGIINQYLGDGVMALFQNNPDNALQACIDMQLMIQAYNHEIKSHGGQPIQVGMGLHFGSLVMGIIGDDTRRDATVISDSVNLAARIESITKIYGADILLTIDAVEKLANPQHFLLRSIGKVHVRGKDESIEVFECYNHQEEETKKCKTSSLKAFSEAIQSFNEGHYEKALHLFSELRVAHANDKIAHSFKEICASKLHESQIF